MRGFISKIKEKVQKAKTSVMATMAGILGLAGLASSAGASPSSAIDFGSNALDVSISDTITTGFNFANMFSEWTMLVLAVIFVPVIVGFIIWLVRKLPRFAQR